ncbi:MAG: XRE family transcriptional regulator [Candidatus Melainabacteria bacterium]|nr:MAG: XRE family transcriptional regulator [Candidatus Melainabacteria bacterium]
MEQEFIEKELFLRNIGNNIRVARKAKNLSQEELAFKINSARNFIGCIERGEKAPTVYVLYKIAAVLNVPIDNLLVI